VELRTAVTSGKKRTDIKYPQEDPRARIREASKRNVQRAAKGEKPELVEASATSGARKQGSEVVEGSTPSETEKKTAHRSAAGNVDSQAMCDSLSPTARVRERYIFG
jgi:hypothetical protein